MVKVNGTDEARSSALVSVDAARTEKFALLPDPKTIRKVVCLMLGGIGDTLVVTPTIHAIRQAYPEAKITLIVRGYVRDLLRASEDIDDLLELRSRSPLEKLRFLSSIALRSWDMWIDLHVPTYNTISSNDDVFRRNLILMKIARARYCIAFAHPVLVRHLTHPRAIPSSKVLQNENISSTTARLLGEVGTISTRKRLPPIAHKTRSEAEALLISRGSEPTTTRIGLFFGSNQPSDVWPLRNICTLLNDISQNLHGVEAVILGGPSETDLISAIYAEFGGHLPTRCVDMVGVLSLSQTIALIDSCAVIVSTDSGPMHIADAIEKPLVSMFSSKNYINIWTPVTKGSIVINKLTECAPCLLSHCNKGNLCLDLITPDEVMEALKRFLPPHELQVSAGRAH